MDIWLAIIKKSDDINIFDDLDVLEKGQSLSNPPPLIDMLKISLSHFDWYKGFLHSSAVIVPIVSELNDREKMELVNSILGVLKRANSKLDNYVLYDHTVGFIIDPAKYQNVTAAQFEEISLDPSNSYPHDLNALKKKSWWKLW